MSATNGDWPTIPAMAAAAARFGAQPAVADGDTRLTYSDLLDSSRRAAAGLVASGVT